MAILAMMFHGRDARATANRMPAPHVRTRQRSHAGLLVSRFIATLNNPAMEIDSG
jgi:hypothetical protein